ncbi:hypothetical protein B0J18DRAFT_261265 [Chaetomium sp. MPI-SDFR-AT-0129]|nr:hypothetical protein B0J18DRAFT_261265 [Chaetomium sp. MPI-SDFR-AT-0129]
MPYPKSAIVIGGSISGLLQGLQLKRNGTTVTLLEQDPINHRPSHDSGVQIGPSVVRLLEKYDATGRPAAVPARFLSVAWRREKLRVLDVVAPRQMSNWATLYLILRANFDGLVSEMVPRAPEGRKGDGRVVYRAGKRVTGLSYEGGGGGEDSEGDEEKAGGMMYVDFEDVTTGEKERIGAEVVIAADGVHSTVRKIMGAGQEKKYSGYIGWRGVVPEHMVSAETVEYFSNRLNFSLMKGTYAITYVIPTETGHVTPGNRLINWVWYFRVPENSPAMDAIFTDIHGKPHAHTVSQGLINPELWADQKARFLPLMNRHLAEIITKTARPFVSKVVDRDCTGAVRNSTAAGNGKDTDNDTRGSFFNGHLILVGDAYTAFRPHMGMASEQAGRHCWQMDAVWRGEMTLAQRDREAARYARRFVLLNRIIGLLGMGSWGELVVTVVVFGGFLGGCALGVC